MFVFASGKHAGVEKIESTKGSESLFHNKECKKTENLFIVKLFYACFSRILNYANDKCGRQKKLL